MIENLFARNGLRPLCRRKFKKTEIRSVDLSESEDLEKIGWQVIKRHKRSVKLEKEKDEDVLFKDRVWSLLYRMGFSHLSGEGGSCIQTNAADGSKPFVGYVAIDDEVALTIECKSQKEWNKKQGISQDVERIKELRATFGRAAQKTVEDQKKRAIVSGIFLGGVTLGDEDAEKAKSANVVLFDEIDLSYYEELVAHLGIAARHQFLADLMRGRDIPGLNIRLPAIKLKFGSGNAYMFAISPDFLLKISYVSHRQKGKGSDINTYQRMMKRSRLKKIREFIDNQGVFPTNIVINIETRMLAFEPSIQRGSGAGETDSGVFGWLTIRPAYKSAWIIDGQHRLFGYSGSAKAAKARLSVLAFSGLKPSDQAGMFININSKQKSVKQSLLQELYAELHWDAAEPAMRVRAIISKVIQSLNDDRSSPFYGRIQTADDGKNEIRCISLTSMFSALDKSELYIASEKNHQIVEYGPLWHPDGPKALKRTSKIVNAWFEAAVEPVLDWWNIGAGEGGGLSMNDGVVALLGVLRSILNFLGREGRLKLVKLEDGELIELLRPYAGAVGKYLLALTPVERQTFRGFRGVQGVTTRQRRMQQAIHSAFPEYNPPGLQDFLSSEKAETNKHAREILENLELLLQRTVIEELREQFGRDEVGWWFKGIPSQVRKDVSARLEEDAGRRGGKEHYFTLINYRVIISNNWDIFGSIFGYGKKNVGKDKGTEWIVDLNNYRNSLMHISSGVHITVEQLEEIKMYFEWAQNQISHSDEAELGACDSDESDE